MVYFEADWDDMHIDAKVVSLLFIHNFRNYFLLENYARLTFSLSECERGLKDGIEGKNQQILKLQ